MGWGINSMARLLRRLNGILMPMMVGVIGYLLGYRFGVGAILPAIVLGTLVGYYVKKWNEEE